MRFAPSGTQIINRTLAWKGETLDKITDALDATRTETLTYTKTHRLSAAVGKYGTFGWTYDTVGNRKTETLNTFVSTYAYPATTNRLTSITPTGQAARAFTYDAAGNVLTDSRTGALGVTFQYDVEGRLSKTFQTSNTAEGATYKYDARSRLASRVVTHAVAPLSTTTLYIHDLDDHIIAETDASGTTLREYIWVDDLPLAVVANANVTNANVTKKIFLPSPFSTRQCECILHLHSDGRRSTTPHRRRDE